MKPRILTLSRSLTFVLPILGAVGTKLLPIPLFGYTLSPFRLLVPLVLLVALILQPWLPTIWRDLPTKFAALIAFWLLFGIASLLWTTDLSQGITELLSIAVGGTVAFSLGVFQKADPRTIDFLRQGWIFALCTMYVIIAWELVTGRHLEGSFVLQNQMIYGGTANLGVQGTLDNPNDLSAFIVFCTPFLLWSLAETSPGLHCHLPWRSGPFSRCSNCIYRSQAFSSYLYAAAHDLLLPIKKAPWPRSAGRSHGSFGHSRGPVGHDNYPGKTVHIGRPGGWQRHHAHSQKPVPERG